MGEWFGAGTRLAFLHNNHLGATEAVTDEKGSVVWSVQYQPFGRPMSVSQRPGFVMNLRLPGQFEDEETGLYYNDHRYYDPDTGRYISPDPLGLRGGINSYAYAGGNPLRYVDPSGLLLFAFDGTGNDESDTKTLSNIVRFGHLYTGDKIYITGPGTKDPKTQIENPWYKGGNASDIAKNPLPARLESIK